MYYSLRPMGRIFMNYFASWGILCVRDEGRRGNKITGVNSVFTIILFYDCFRTLITGYLVGGHLMGVQLYFVS